MKKGPGSVFHGFLLAAATARLSELTDLATAGETEIITKRGTPIDLEALRQLTASMLPQAEDAADFIRRTRDDARY